MQKTSNKIPSMQDHPDYDETIEEVVQKRFDQSLMDQAMRNAKREEQAEALYVMLKLNKK